MGLLYRDVCVCGMKEREIERGCVLRRYCMKECILDRQTERGIFVVVGTYVHVLR